MSRRLEIELTSERPDGTWTWRAAGAKQPKGELSASLLPEGAKVGDVVRADADFLVEGIEILSILPPKAARKEPERLAIVGTRTDEPLVTTQLAPKGRGGDRRGGRRDRGDRPDRGDRGDRAGRGERRDRPEGRGRSEGRGERPRGPRPDPVPERPKPKRLRPGRQHRNAVLDALPVAHRPIAEQVLRGGVPAVREAIAKQNEQAKNENRPEVPADQLVALAEQLLPALRAAEWMDRAESALRDLDQLDLRDLRSVVVAADGAAKGDEANSLKQQLQDGLTRRVEEEQTLWISDITANLDAGRFVRALRLSSRSPKAGAPLPPELATRLIVAVSEGLTPTVNQDLWAAAVDALAYAPVRNQVVPAGRPEQPSEALLEAVKRVGDRLPGIVELFGLDPAEVAKAAKRRPRGGRAGAKKPAKKAPAKPSKPSEVEKVEVPVEGGSPAVVHEEAERAIVAELTEEPTAPVDEKAPEPSPDAAEEPQAGAEQAEEAEQAEPMEPADAVDPKDPATGAAYGGDADQAQA